MKDIGEFIRHDPEVKMLRWTRSTYSMVELEDSSSDDVDIFSGSENNVPGEVYYSREEVEVQNKVHAYEEHATSR